MNQIKLHLAHVYKEDVNKVIEIITNNLDRSAHDRRPVRKTLGHRAVLQGDQAEPADQDLRRDENAVKSQIYVALITYLLLQPIERTIAKKSHVFSDFVEKIRMCLCFYLTLDYARNHVGEGAKRVTGQSKVNFDVGRDLFSASS